MLEKINTIDYDLFMFIIIRDIILRREGNFLNHEKCVRVQQHFVPHAWRS